MYLLPARGTRPLADTTGPGLSRHLVPALRSDAMLADHARPPQGLAAWAQLPPPPPPDLRPCAVPGCLAQILSLASPGTEPMQTRGTGETRAGGARMPGRPPPSQVVSGHFLLWLGLAHPPSLLQAWGRRRTPVCWPEGPAVLPCSSPMWTPPRASGSLRRGSDWSPLGAPRRQSRHPPASLPLRPAPCSPRPSGLARAGDFLPVWTGQEADPASLGHTSWPRSRAGPRAGLVQAWPSGQSDGRWSWAGAEGCRQMARRWQRAWKASRPGPPQLGFHSPPRGRRLSRGSLFQPRGHSHGAQRQALHTKPSPAGGP